MRRSLVIALLAVTGSLEAAAAPTGPHWTILGPAVSYHASDGHAQVRRREFAETHCMREPEAIPIAVAPRCRQIRGVEETRRWNERHAAIGLERGHHARRHTTRSFVTLIEDSYGQMGWMSGAGWTWRVAQWQGWQSHAGVAGGLWRRSVLGEDASHLRRATRAFAMPVLLIDSPASGVGVAVTFMPTVSVGGQILNPTAVWTVQLRFRPLD
jgi:hypothetical protein